MEIKMEREKTEINYGDGFINVYLPREDGFDHGNLVAPSPIFTVDSLYKFSDQVLNDRHLFLGKKTIHHTHFDFDDVDSNGLNSGRSSVLGEKDSNVKTIKLSLDASQQGVNIRHRRRFNERLSAYVSNNRKYNETVKIKQYSKSATNPRNVREVRSKGMRESVSRGVRESSPRSIKDISNKPRKNLITPVLTLGTPRRGVSFEKALKSDAIGLPPLNKTRTMTRQKSCFGKEDTFWFPSSALRGIEPKHGHATVRPSSRQFKVWRQSTQMLLDNERFSPMTWPNQNEIMITQKTFV